MTTPKAADFGSDVEKRYSDLAATYDQFAGTCIREVCEYSVSLLPAIAPGSRVLDNACGTALFTIALLEKHPNVHIDAVDIAPGMVDSVQGLVKSNGWGKNVKTAVMDGKKLAFEDGTFDVSSTMFAIFFFPVEGAQEIYRTLKVGGTALVSSWEMPGWLPFLHEVQEVIKPGEEKVVVPLMDKWAKKETLIQTLKNAGFQGVEVTRKVALASRTNLEDLADLMRTVIEPMRKEAWSPEELSKIPDAIRQVLTTQKETFVVERENGIIGIRMIAWVALARK